MISDDEVSKKREIHKIRVVGNAEYPQTANVFIDDKEIHGVTKYELSHEASGLAKMTLWVYGDIDFEEYGAVDIIKTDIDLAVDILRDAVKDNRIDTAKMGEILADILQYMKK